LNDLLLYVEYQKEKEEDKTKETIKTDNTDDNKIVPAPKDPNAGTEYKENTQANDNLTTNNDNDLETTTSLLQVNGKWPAVHWNYRKTEICSGVLITKAILPVDWELIKGKLKMNATNPDTKKTSSINRILSGVSRNSFTMTFMTTPRRSVQFHQKELIYPVKIR